MCQELSTYVLNRQQKKENKYIIDKKKVHGLRLRETLILIYFDFVYLYEEFGIIFIIYSIVWINFLNRLDRQASAKGRKNISFKSLISKSITLI